ncbi:MAG: putative bifunctional diguanylate cyclase/phosphodiesterase, partial [Solirubrobacteraceae bacterium]
MPLLHLLLPDLAAVTRRSRGAVAAAAGLMFALLAANLAQTQFGLGGEALEKPLNAWGQNVVLACACAVVAIRVLTGGAPGSRPLLAAMCLWTLGNLWWGFVLYGLEETPFPSPADAGWLAFYPCAYLCLGLRLRASARDLPRSAWFDGLIGILSVGALGVTFVVAPVLAGAEGSRAAVLTNAAYPLADLLLLAVTIAVLVLHGWRAGRAWALLGAGFALFALADSIYLARLAADSYSAGTVLDSLWVVALVIMALASWQPLERPREVDPGHLGVMVPPLLFALAALGLLVYAGLEHVPAVPVALAGAAVLAAMARTALTVREIRGFHEARRQAATDELTGLPNRREFGHQLRSHLARARERSEPLALLIIDIDRFKELNDALGHHAGDAVLAQIGPRLRTILRPDDVLARLGGDEFAVLLPRARSAEEIGRRIARTLEDRFPVDGIDVQVAASVGIALFPEHGEDADTLLRRADVAMYQAKTSRSGHAFYAREQDRNTRARLELIGQLRDAVDLGQLVVHYQPIIDLGTGAVTEAEALVRWQHPEHGLLAPGEFVPLAEQTGVMRKLTDHVLETALSQAAYWRSEGLDIGVAVNVSASTLLEAGWTEAVTAALQRWSTPPARLRIEITEDALMVDPERALAIARKLGDAGIGVSLDDFGTGYSSLGLLKQLAVDELKIDRTFVGNALHDPADAAIVQAVTGLGRQLGLRVVAEGVEDEATLRAVAEWGATLAQGFYISRPLPAE